ncbi:helix-turn-helix transcriptional regulator [Halioxenophilus aromaticivorans]|uniref:Ornithine utilization transcriptional regulator OruR n=1 Tax=Halioxenophilus aromaticivorans TaxID=1306992 RepID=A0AAV3TYB1_9ALTE
MNSTFQPMIKTQVERLHSVLLRDFNHLDTARLAAAAGIASDWRQKPDCLTFSDYYRLLTHIATHHAPDIVVRMAREIRIREYGALGYAVWSGGTLGQSLEMLMHIVEWQHPYVRLQIKVGREQALIRCQIQPRGVEFYRVLIEDSLLTLWQLIQSRMPDGLAACASFAHFTYAQPSYAGQYQQFLGCKVVFDQDFSMLAIPAQWLHVATQLASQSEQWRATPARVRRTLALSKADLVKEVKTLLLERSVECAFDMAKTARMMAVSERSLRRHLAAAGASFRQICTQVRMELAAQYLLNTGLSMQEIAYLLGYAQENNFYRAFRGYYATSPALFRSQSRADNHSQS